MISVQITVPQSIDFLKEIFSFSAKFKSIIPTVLQLTKKNFTGDLNNLELPLQNSSVEQPLQTSRAAFLLTANNFIRLFHPLLSTK